jgi:tetratricopeptide (TPR) repeat protein
VFKSAWVRAGVAVLLGWAVMGPAAAPAAESSGAAPPAARQTAPTDLSTPGDNVLMVTNPQARACQDAAKQGDLAGAGVNQCTQALASPLVSQSDLAALYTDRAAVYLQHRRYAEAKSDCDAALKIDPTLADAYVNRGASLLGLKQYAEAIADIDHGLALRPDLPEKAYFNRAIADEHLDDMKAAYQDYLKASELNPRWEAPKSELARFTLSPAPLAR